MPIPEVTDWRSPSEQVGQRMYGTTPPPPTQDRSWWDVVTGMVPFSREIKASHYAAEERKEEVRQGYQDRGVYLRDTSGSFGPSGPQGSHTDSHPYFSGTAYPNMSLSDFNQGYSREDENVAYIFDVRDAILMNTADALMKQSGDAGFGIQGPPFRPPVDDSMFTDPSGGSGSRGGGGGGGPKYIAPDRRVIEELVGDKQIVLTGKRRPELNKIVDAFMRDHKRQFEGVSVDPKQTIMEDIRATAEYKRIHTLRGEATDENTWVNQRQDRLEQLGLGSKAAEARGIGLATTGAALASIDIGKFQAGKGRKDITMMRRLEKVAEQVGGLL